MRERDFKPLYGQPEPKLRVGDRVAFRRSSGKVQYGTISEVYEGEGLVKVEFCERMLQKVLPFGEVSTSAYSFAIGARKTGSRRSTGRKRRTGRRRPARRAARRR